MRQHQSFNNQYNVVTRTFSARPMEMYPVGLESAEKQSFITSKKTGKVEMAAVLPRDDKFCRSDILAVLLVTNNQEREMWTEFWRRTQKA